MKIDRLKQNSYLRLKFFESENPVFIHFIKVGGLPFCGELFKIKISGIK